MSRTTILTHRKAGGFEKSSENLCGGINPFREGREIDSKIDLLGAEKELSQDKRMFDCFLIRLVQVGSHPAPPFEINATCGEKA